MSTATEQPATELQNFLILRRRGWSRAEMLALAGERSKQVSDAMPDLRWIRSYAVDEGDAGIGTVCIYQATDQEAIRRHATEAGLPVDEIVPIVDLIVLRPDPAAA
jgi:hypothetical protein